MTVEVRKSRLIAGLRLALLFALLGWSWLDRGARLLRAHSQLAMLPQVGR